MTTGAPASGVAVATVDVTTTATGAGPAGSGPGETFTARNESIRPGFRRRHGNGNAVDDIVVVT